MYLENNLDGVFAIDLNTSWEIFNSTISDQDEIIHHSFFISPTGIVMLHSLMEPTYFTTVWDVTTLEFNLDTIINNKGDLPSE